MSFWYATGKRWPVSLIQLKFPNSSLHIGWTFYTKLLIKLHTYRIWTKNNGIKPPVLSFFSAIFLSHFQSLNIEFVVYWNRALMFRKNNQSFQTQSQITIVIVDTKKIFRKVENRLMWRFKKGPVSVCYTDFHI